MSQQDLAALQALTVIIAPVILVCVAVLAYHAGRAVEKYFGSPDFLVEVCMLIYSQRTD